MRFSDLYNENCPLIVSSKSIDNVKKSRPELSGEIDNLIKKKIVRVED